MKSLMILLCLLAISLAGCNGGAVSLYGDNDAVGARVGAEIAENIEAGVLSYWYPYDDNDSQIWGAYSLYHFPDIVELPNPLDPEKTLEATTYIGAQLSLDSNYEDYVSLVTGVIFQKVFFVEYQPKAFDNKASMEDDKVVFGLRITF